MGKIDREREAEKNKVEIRIIKKTTKRQIRRRVRQNMKVAVARSSD